MHGDVCNLIGNIEGLIFRDVIATMLVYRQQKISYWFRLLKFINMAETTLSFESLGTGSIISRPGCIQSLNKDH